METATIFTTGFANKIPTGALLLVSDQPMIPEGVKTAESDSTCNRAIRGNAPAGRYRIVETVDQWRVDG
jgi:nucleoside phosphorylase